MVNIDNSKEFAAAFAKDWHEKAVEQGHRRNKNIGIVLALIWLFLGAGPVYTSIQGMLNPTHTIKKATEEKDQKNTIENSNSSNQARPIEQ